MLIIKKIGGTRSREQICFSLVIGAFHHVNKREEAPFMVELEYRTWKAWLALLCRIINKSSKSGGRHFQK